MNIFCVGTLKKESRELHDHLILWKLFLLEKQNRWQSNQFQNYLPIKDLFSDYYFFN